MAARLRLSYPCRVRSTVPEEGAEGVHSDCVVVVLKSLPIAIIRTRLLALSYTHPTVSSALTTAIGRHAEFRVPAISISIAASLAATRAYTAHVARDRSDATASPRVSAPASAARAASALSGLSLSRRDSDEQPSPQDSRAHQLQRLAPRDGAAGQPLRQLVEGVFLRRILSGGVHPNLFVFCPHRISAFPHRFPEAARSATRSKTSRSRFCC